MQRFEAGASGTIRMIEARAVGLAAKIVAGADILRAGVLNRPGHSFLTSALLAIRAKEADLLGRPEMARSYREFRRVADKAFLDRS